MYVALLAFGLSWSPIKTEVIVLVAFTSSGELEASNLLVEKYCSADGLKTPWQLWCNVYVNQ